jgi:hypothetical protein
MKRLEVDLRPLVGPGIASLLALALLAATWVIAGDWLQTRSDDFRRARSELAQAASRYRNASDDQQVYQEYATRFRQMRASGWIGQEQRLGWIEALQRANADLRLPTLRYDIGEQNQVEPNEVSSHLELHRTPMTLNLGALHEGDVIELLQRLQAMGQGLMSVERCGLSRNGDRVRLDADAANVNIECSLDWYTLTMQRRKDSSKTAQGGQP